ncbi:MAG: phenylacetate--CoA ligase family protein [Proteobacteria bacterium]|nr:phenylacetate--CoA ligase family protein [Pseudomonadota bacterium]
MMAGFFNIIPKRARTALYRAVQSAKGETGRYGFADATEQVAYLPLGDLAALQLRRLRQTLVYAGEKVPYWRDLFKREGFHPKGVTRSSDIEVLPILTKDIIRAEGDRMLSADYDKSRLVVRKTGGSTGEPLVYCVDRESLERQMAINLRGFRLLGLRDDDRVAKIWGYGKSHRLENALASVSSRLFLDAFYSGDAQMESWLEQLLQFEPKAIYGYAGAISHFARFLKRTGRQRPLSSLNVICTTSEKLFPEMAEVTREVFGVPVADMYGCHESIRIASDCLHGHMHIHMDGTLTEFVHDQGVADGPGKIIITTLLSRAMPFIRYDVGDMGTDSSSKCPCGLELPIMTLDVGKVHHIFQLPGGRKVHSTVLHKPVFQLPGIASFQIRHAALGKIVISAVPLKDQVETMTGELRAVAATFEKDLGPGVVVETRIVDGIPLTPSGKQLAIVSDVAEDKNKPVDREDGR